MKKQTYNNSVNVDAFDIAAFKEVHEKSKDVRRMVEDHKDEEHFENLLEDGFGSLYKLAPRVRDADEVKPDRWLNRTIINQMTSLKEYDEIRDYTQGDDLIAVGSMGMLDQVMRDIPDEVKKEQKELQDLQNMLNEGITGGQVLQTRQGICPERRNHFPR